MRQLLGLHPCDDVGDRIGAEETANHHRRRHLDVQDQGVEIKGIGEDRDVVAEDKLVADQTDAEVLEEACADKQELRASEKQKAEEHRR